MLLLVGVVRAHHTHQQERPTLPNAQDRFLLPVHRVWWSGLFARATHTTSTSKHTFLTYITTNTLLSTECYWCLYVHVSVRARKTLNS